MLLTSENVCGPLSVSVTVMTTDTVGAVPPTVATMALAGKVGRPVAVVCCRETAVGRAVTCRAKGGRRAGREWL